MVFGNCTSDQGNLRFRLQPEEELQLTKFLMDRAPDAVFWVAKDARFLYVNNAACRLAGYSREQLLSMTMHDVDPDFSPKVWSDHWRTIKQQGCLYLESLHQTKEGLSNSVEITLTYLEYHGREYGCIFVRDITKRQQLKVAQNRAAEALECRVQDSTAELRDTNEQLCQEICERKRAESDLAAEEQRFQATFNSAAVGIAHVGIDGKWLLVNQKLCDIVGYTQEELQSQTFQDITHPDDLDAEFEYIRRILATEIQTYSMEKRYIRKDASYVWINLTVSLVRVPKGEPKYFIAVVEDISERKQAEVKVRQALEQEKELGELRAGFVSMVSHEFRNPLHIISFSTSLVKRHSHQWTEEKKLKYLHRIQTAVEHLSELMDEVLIIGRSEAGKLTLSPRALDLEQFCRDLVAQLKLSHSSQHPVTFKSLGDCSTACVDEKLLQPILTNLLSNAIKYSPTGSKVVFALSCRDAEVILQIKDQGIGIPAADQQRLFEPFHRGKNVGDIPGTGLGLAVVKKLVDIHGGQISVASEVGVGTTFTITLPLGKPVEAGASTPLISTTD